MPILTPPDKTPTNSAPALFFAKKRASADEAFKEAIRVAKESNDIVDVTGRATTLKKSGDRFVGLCPIHSENTPSFSVTPATGTYHCFGCGAHGDVIHFMEEAYGMSFTDAVKALLPAGTNIHGNMEALAIIPRTVKLEEKPSKIEISPEREQACYEALEMADRHFAYQLESTPEPMAYLAKRHISSAMLERYAIGFAAAEWRGLAKVEAFKDYSNNVALVDAGLVRIKEIEKKEPTSLAEKVAEISKSQNSSPRVNRYDYFRNRITFGIRDLEGRVIAFGARTLGDEDPKYLNSPETALFRKRDELFGLYEARSDIVSYGIAIVVEGYMDAVGLAEAGLPIAVSTMGTAVSAEKLSLLVCYTPEIIFMFDPDAAGRKASWAALKAAIPFSGKTLFRFATPPDNLDPDEWAIRDGAAVVERFARSSPTLSQFMMKELSARHDVETPEGRKDLLAEGREIIAQLPSDSPLFKMLESQISILGKEAPVRQVKLQPLTVEQKTVSQRPQLSHMPVEERLIEAAAMAPGIAQEMRPTIARSLLEGIASGSGLGPDEIKDVGSNWLARFDSAVSDARINGVQAIPGGMDTEIATQIRQSGDELAKQIGARLAKRQSKKLLDSRLQSGEINTAQYFQEVSAGIQMRRDQAVDENQSQSRPVYPRERG